MAPMPEASPLPQAPIVIGTAGHVDHGKSTLVKALTGIDPDRLAEEQARSMTIELGFAWFTLPHGRAVSIVDVPGHERFIKTMLAGVGGIDAAMLVVAADEGPMPQTAEHLAILDLLGIERGVVALTKRDLVDDDWLALVTEEVRERLHGTTLAAAPIIPISAQTGDNLPQLLQALELLAETSSRQLHQAGARLPIDRVFSVAGFGTVVTGTLSGGELAVGDTLQLYPHDRLVRVRGLQNHQHAVPRAAPGIRTAVNLSGIATAEILRGDVLAPPGIMTPSQRVDVRLSLLASAPAPLRQNDGVDFFTGASEIAARVTLLDREQVEPGETAWVQLRLRAPVAVLQGDHFIVRRASPSETIGGGVIVAANPARHKRFRPETVQALETLASGTPAELVLQHLAHAPLELRQLRADLPGMLEPELKAALSNLLTSGDVVRLGARLGDSRPADFVATRTAWTALLLRLTALLSTFHAMQPLHPGMAREEVRRRLGITSPRLFDDLVLTAAFEKAVVDDGATLRQPAFRITLDPRRRSLADTWLAALQAEPYAPPGPHEIGLDPETLAALEHLGEIIKVADGVYFAPAAWESLTRATLAYIDGQGTISLAQFRDHFGTSRKYAQAALEQLDRQKITRRVGDNRIRGTRAEVQESPG